MTIAQLHSKYISLGYSASDARLLVAEEIIIAKIAHSELAERVTLKGGIVMYNLTKNNRRITRDIDFDFIRYSIDNNSLITFINLLNKVDDGFVIRIIGEIESLHQEDYQGARINILIEDSRKKRLRLKLDIGVHTYHAIEQANVAFSFDINKNNIMLKANPPEQILVEKLLSLARFGVASTRYKDVYDIYFLIKEKCVSIKKVRDILQLFFCKSSKKPNDIEDLQTIIEDTLSNNDFALEATKPVFRWIDVSFDDLKAVIIDFVHKL